MRGIKRLHRDSINCKLVLLRAVTKAADADVGAEIWRVMARMEKAIEKKNKRRMRARYDSTRLTAIFRDERGMARIIILF